MTELGQECRQPPCRALTSDYHPWLSPGWDKFRSYLVRWASPAPESSLWIRNWFLACDIRLKNEIRLQWQLEVRWETGSSWKWGNPGLWHTHRASSRHNKCHHALVDWKIVVYMLSKNKFEPFLFPPSVCHCLEGSATFWNQWIKWASRMYSGS